MLLETTTLQTELNYILTETAKLPWRWDVTTRAYDDVRAFDIRVADDAIAPPFLPNFTIKHGTAGYEVSTFLHADDHDDSPQPPDETLEAAFDFVPCFLAVMLEEWGLQRIARDLPEKA